MGDKECVRGDVDSQRTKGRARKKSIRRMKKGLDLRPQIQTSDLRDQTSDCARGREQKSAEISKRSGLKGLRSEV